jgi:predicted nucleic acid-binding protein
VASLTTGVTFDTGALIALERRERRMRTVMLAATEDGMAITVPAGVIIEWWRGSARQAEILESITVEPTTPQLAKLAGEAIAAVPGSGPIDALVMASAAQRGDIVYTSDFEDLDRLGKHFPAVRILTTSAAAR